MAENQGFMAGKRGLIMGVANDRSIAWGIASKVHGQGAVLDELRAGALATAASTDATSSTTTQEVDG